MSGEPFLHGRVELELPPTTKTAEQVGDFLRRIVHRGELGPGDRLPAERELAATLGIGRVTLREALQALEDEGYIVRRRGVTGGAFLTDLARPFAAHRARLMEDRAGMEEVFDMREGVEVQIARLAAVRRTARDVTAIRKANEELRGARTSADFRRLDLHFHGLLAAAARSRRLTALMYSTRGELFDHASATVGAAPSTTAQSELIEALVNSIADEHAPLVDAVEARDADAAGEAMRRYLQTARETLLLALKASLRKR